MRRVGDVAAREDPVRARLQASSTTTPLSIRAIPSTSSVRGATPMPTTTAAQSIVLPSESRTRSARPDPSIASTPAPSSISTPWSSWTSR